MKDLEKGIIAVVVLLTTYKVGKLVGQVDGIVRTAKSFYRHEEKEKLALKEE